MDLKLLYIPIFYGLDKKYSLWYLMEHFFGTLKIMEIALFVDKPLVI